MVYEGDVIENDINNIVGPSNGRLDSRVHTNDVRVKRKNRNCTNRS